MVDKYVCFKKKTIESIFTNFQGELFSEFKQKFREISHLMDCMGCERCKVSNFQSILNCILKAIFIINFELTVS